MMFIFIFFYFSVNTFSTRRSTPIFTCNMVSCSKFHLVGTFEKSFFDFLNSYLMRKEKLRKNEVKTANIRFRQIEIFHFFVISKIIIWKSWNFYPIFNLVIYIGSICFFLFFCNFGLFIDILDFEVFKS
jgi:hypothetical protein